MAWKVKVEDLKTGFDLDVKNPHREEAEEDKSLTEIVASLEKSLSNSQQLLQKIKAQFV